MDGVLRSPQTPQSGPAHCTGGRGVYGVPEGVPANRGTPQSGPGEPRSPARARALYGGPGGVAPLIEGSGWAIDQPKGQPESIVVAGVVQRQTRRPPSEQPIPGPRKVEIGHMLLLCGVFSGTSQSGRLALGLPLQHIFAKIDPKILQTIFRSKKTLRNWLPVLFHVQMCLVAYPRCGACNCIGVGGAGATRLGRMCARGALQLRGKSRARVLFQRVAARLRRLLAHESHRQGCA